MTDGNQANGEIRIYLDIGTGTLPSPSDVQWLALMGRARTKPLSAAILAAARAAQNFISATKRSQGTGQINKHTLVCFEVERDQVSAIQAVLDAQAALRSIVGNNFVKIPAVLLAELRDSAVDLGYTVAQANQLSVTLINQPGYPQTWSRGYPDSGAGAIPQAQAYLAARAAVWYA